MINPSLKSVDPLDGLIELLAEIPECHAPGGSLYRYLHANAKVATNQRFSVKTEKAVDFAPFGGVVFPLFSMGNINSLDLMGLDELILFAFYWANRNRYRHVADFGTNIGLHSIIMCRCGYEVRSFEPDPAHLIELKRRLALNKCGVELFEAAVSTEGGRHSFTRVLGNTTGSHLSGAKADPYGDLETFEVELLPYGPQMEWADLVKIDIEGHEAVVLCDTTADSWAATDAVAEVGTEENAAQIYEHFAGLPVNLFAQKTGWRRVETLADMPTSHRDGSLFISTKSEMPWNNGGAA